MLVLSRKAQEKIRIGDDITITIVKLKGKTVRVGIEAPASTPVLRGELSFEGEPDRQPPKPQRKPTRNASSTRAEVKDCQSWTSDREACVTHTRVARSRVASVLPTVLGDAGPLREMLHRRGATNEC